MRRCVAEKLDALQLARGPRDQERDTVQLFLGSRLNHVLESYPAPRAFLVLELGLLSVLPEYDDDQLFQNLSEQKRRAVTILSEVVMELTQFLGEVRSLRLPDLRLRRVPGGYREAGRWDTPDDRSLRVPGLQHGVQGCRSIHGASPEGDAERYDFVVIVVVWG